MIVGVPKEIKNHEYRVGLTPEAVAELIGDGHSVLVETGAGLGIGCDDEAYAAAGATLCTLDEVFQQAELIVKVKEPQAIECARFRPGQTLFTYLHLAADPAQAEGLKASGVTAIAYETVTSREGALPLLTPMSEVAGRMAIQVGAACLQKANGGRGVLLGGVPGVAPGQVVILGGGVSGTQAATMAVGLGAEVTVLDRALPALRRIDAQFQGRVRSLHANSQAVADACAQADLIVGAVLVPGAKAPRLLSRAQLETLRPGAALVDISIDQGGCFESSRPTTHAEPTYLEAGIVHYCVTNMPGAVARTSTYALNAATLPFVRALANLGTETALARDPHLAAGLNIQGGQVRHPAVAEALTGVAA
ncbi:MAG: alanine dehydrogenase [Pseudomonadales bacterium]|nr:alanine dehydrogenase [Pseudomonadales bacterium]MDA0956129.1 alanine dehydrogenase [Pseudomonadota bacterium]